MEINAVDIDDFAELSDVQRYDFIFWFIKCLISPIWDFEQLKSRLLVISQFIGMWWWVRWKVRSWDSGTTCAFTSTSTMAQSLPPSTVIPFGVKKESNVWSSQSLTSHRYCLAGLGLPEGAVAMLKSKKPEFLEERIVLGAFNSTWGNLRTGQFQGSVSNIQVADHKVFLLDKLLFVSWHKMYCAINPGVWGEPQLGGPDIASLWQSGGGKQDFCIYNFCYQEYSICICRYLPGKMVAGRGGRGTLEFMRSQSFLSALTTRTRMTHWSLALPWSKRMPCSLVRFVVFPSKELFIRQRRGSRNLWSHMYREYKGESSTVDPLTQRSNIVMIQGVAWNDPSH